MIEVLVQQLLQCISLQDLCGVVQTNVICSFGDVSEIGNRHDQLLKKLLRVWVEEKMKKQKSQPRCYF